MHCEETGDPRPEGRGLSRGDAMDPKRMLKEAEMEMRRLRRRGTVTGAVVQARRFCEKGIREFKSDAEMLEAARVLFELRSEIEIYPGRGHGWFNSAPDFALVLKRMEKFLVERFGL